MIDLEMNKKLFFETLTSEVDRPGLGELIEWLETTDFFEAPASSKYHLAEAGGLCQHSLNVYHRLKDFLWDESRKNGRFYGNDSIAIVALLHDVCKADFYTVSTKNQKTYDPDKVAAAERWQVKHDNGGSFIWETVPTYTIDEKFVYGHGEKSVYLIGKFMDLSDEEAQAIRYHMGPYQDGEMKNASACFQKNPLAFWLHMADSAATFLDESEARK